MPEETAHRFAPKARVGVYQRRESAVGRTFLRFSFAATAVAPEPGFTFDHGIERTLWMTRDEIAAAIERFRSPWVRASVDDFPAGRHLPLDMIRTL